MLEKKLLTPEVKELLIKHQTLWIDEGEAWHGGFVKGLEYLLAANGESLDGVFTEEKPK